jgi:hypothetical protein
MNVQSIFWFVMDMAPCTYYSKNVNTSLNNFHIIIFCVPMKFLGLHNCVKFWIIDFFSWYVRLKEKTMTHIYSIDDNVPFFWLWDHIFIIGFEHNWPFQMDFSWIFPWIGLKFNKEMEIRLKFIFKWDNCQITWMNLKFINLIAFVTQR